MPVGWASVIAVAVVLSYGAMRPHTADPFLPSLPDRPRPRSFLVSGSLVDVQSVRYLIPLYAALPLIYAVGVSQAWKWNRAAGAALASALVGLFALQQVRWYRSSAGDRGTARVIPVFGTATFGTRGRTTGRATK